jgi:hypothetical protein
MAGYAASAMLGARVIRIDRPQVPRAADRSWNASRGTIGGALGSVNDVVEDVRVVRSWSSDDLVERWLAIREAWTQTTFYVFHPESWR